MIFILLFFVLDRVIGGFLETPKKILIRDMKYDPYWRWKEFYEQPANSLDLILLGSSHCYRNFDPKIFNEHIKLNTMNMGSSVQTPLTSYYVLQEILRNQTPGYVIMELYWVSLEGGKEFENANYNFENMHWSANKLEFFMHAFPVEDSGRVFLKSFHYKNNFENTIRHLRGKDISWATGDYYGGRGYLANRNVATTEGLQKTNQFKGVSFDAGKIPLRNVQYLEKVIELCKARGIKLVFVTAPLPPTSLAMVKNYSEAHEFFMAIAQKHGITYMDYNMPEYQMDLADTDFKDDDHLNVVGVEKFDLNLIGRLLELGIGPKDGKN